MSAPVERVSGDPQESHVVSTEQPAQEAAQESETSPSADHSELDTTSAPPIEPDVGALSIGVESSAPISDEAHSAPVAPATVDAQKVQEDDQPPSLPPAPAVVASAPAEPRSETEEHWPLKEIVWPPLTSDQLPQRRVKIVLQNANGPCSNVLLLRGDIQILPANRTSITYVHLSALLGDYLLKRESLDLDQALRVLPRTLRGLDVNVCFSSTTGFQADGAGDELALFKAADVPLVHGWLADPEDNEQFSALSKSDNYDAAAALLVEADEISKGMLVGDANDASPEEIERAVEARSTWTPEQHDLVRRAMLVRAFFDSTKSQLSFPGLFELASSLQPGSLVALFRASHLSVLLRSPLNSGPALYTLVTDSSFQHATTVVWESLEDADGSSAEFFDAELRMARLTDDFVPRRAPQAQQHGSAVPQIDVSAARASNDPDLALAAELQQEEYDADRERRARADQRRGPQVAPDVYRNQYDQPRPQQPAVATAPTAGKKAKKDCLIQ